MGNQQNVDTVLAELKEQRKRKENINPIFITGDKNDLNLENIHDNYGIIGHIHAPVTIINGSKKLSEQENALISIFKKLDVVKQAQLLAYAAELDRREW